MEVSAFIKTLNHSTITSHWFVSIYTARSSFKLSVCVCNCARIHWSDVIISLTARIRWSDVIISLIARAVLWSDAIIIISLSELYYIEVCIEPNLKATSQYLRRRRSVWTDPMNLIRVVVADYATDSFVLLRHKHFDIFDSVFVHCIN